jgi:Mrp family chromosome partitioning ATPase/uncharacterized protein involved in exopolysaccharide biosynthesis
MRRLLFKRTQLLCLILHPLTEYDDSVMDIAYLIRILARRKWLILSVMLATAAATYLFIGRKPKQYKATVIMATGIVNYKGINSDNSDAFVQQYQVDNAFSNLIEFTQSRSTLKILGIEMLKHDLSASPSGPEKAFRQGNPALVGLTPDDFTAKSDALRQEISKINLDSLTDPSFSPDLDFLLDRVSRAYGYDHDALSACLAIKRKGTTDYLSIELITENPALSRFMANTYSTRFMRYYHNLSVREKRKSVEAFSRLSEDKKQVVDSITDLRFMYLKQKGLPALGKQSEELIAQIAKLEIDQQRASARKRSAAESVEKLDKYMNDGKKRDVDVTQGRVLEKNSTDEQFQRVRELTKRSIETGGKDEDVETELAEAKSDLERTVQSSAKVLGKQRPEDSKRTREDLYKEKVSIDMDRIEASESSSRLSQEIWSLKNKLSSMAASDEISSKLESDEERARKEFEEADAEFVKAKMNLENAVNPLSIVENAQLPEHPEPTRQTMISAFAAIVSGTLTCILLFLFAYLDNTIQSIDSFKKHTTDLAFLGTVCTIPVKGLDFNQVFAGKITAPAFSSFRDNVRKIRTQVLQSNQRVFLITSPKNKEGKTFIMHALAYSLAANNKKVLMLDTNFKMPLPDAYAAQASPNSALLNQLIREYGLAEVFQQKEKGQMDPEDHFVDVIGNTGMHSSPSELLEHEAFVQFLTALKGHYDFILLEAAALNQNSDAQELLPYVDRVIGVFNARMAIKQQDAATIAFLRGLGERYGGSVLTQMDAQNIA